jgi:hypothetical protein
MLTADMLAGIGAFAMAILALLAIIVLFMRSWK